MSAILDFSKGKAAIAITENGETPWHGYGTRVPGNADLDQWRIAAGLDFHVDTRPCYTTMNDSQILVPDRRVLVRDDTNAPLSVVSDRYKVVQTKEIFEFFKDLCSDLSFELETAGALDEGKRVWALAKTPDNFRIMGQDEVNGYLLLATSFDGSLATSARFTTVRVVCQNTLSAAQRDKKNVATVRHVSKFDDRAVKAQLGISGDVMAQFEKDATLLSQAEISPDETRAYFESLLGNAAFEFDKSGKKEPENRTDFSKKFKAIIDCYLNGDGAQYKSSKDTLWGAVNAVTNFVDHKAQSKTASSRQNQAWFGHGESLKNEAFKLALATAA